MRAEIPNVRNEPTSIGISSGPNVISHFPSITNTNELNGFPRSISGNVRSVRFT